MNLNSLLSEDLTVVGVIDPDAFVAGEQLTAAIDMSKYDRLLAILMLGDRVAGASVAFALKASATSGGTYAAITNKSATTIADESPLTGASNKQVLINLRGGEVDSNKRYVKGSVTVSGSPSGVEYAVIILGRPVSRPADDNNLSSVKQIVN